MKLTTPDKASALMTENAASVGRSFVTAVGYGVGLLMLVPVWYLWALFPVLVQPPFSGALFQKAAPTVTIGVDAIPRDATGRGLIPVDVVKRACKPNFWLKPIMGRAPYTTLHVTGGPQGQTADVRVSCATYQAITQRHNCRYALADALPIGHSACVVTSGGGPPILRRDFVVLRPGRPADVVERRSLGKHAAIDRMYGRLDTRDGPMTTTEAEEWVASFSNRATPHKWIIEADGHLVGAIRLDATSRDDVRSLAIGLCHPDDLGRGIGSRALRLVTADAFDRLDVRRIMIRVLDYNDRAIRAYAACGFEEVRREPSGVVVDGCEHDDVIMVLDA